MKNENTLYIDKNKTKLLLSENVYSIAASVVEEKKYILSGNLFLNEKETEKRILILVSFEGITLSQELAAKYNLSYSLKYGAFKYAKTDKNTNFSISFSAPSNIESKELDIIKLF
jgi:hypothetical protein